MNLWVDAYRMYPYHFITRHKLLPPAPKAKGWTKHLGPNEARLMMHDIDHMVMSREHEDRKFKPIFVAPPTTAWDNHYSGIKPLQEAADLGQGNIHSST